MHVDRATECSRAPRHEYLVEPEKITSARRAVLHIHGALGHDARAIVHTWAKMVGILAMPAFGGRRLRPIIPRNMQKETIQLAKTWARRCGIAVAAVLVLWGVLYAAAPSLIKWQLQKQGSAYLGRTLTVERVKFEPWKLALTLENVHLGRAPGATESTAQASIGRLYVNLQASSLWHLAPVLQAVEVDRPEVRVARTGDGHYDIDDLLLKFEPKPDEPKKESSHFALYNIQVRDGAVDFDDRPMKTVQQVRDLQLGIPFISNLPSQVEILVKPQLSFALNGSRFDTSAQAVPFADERKGELHLRFNGVDLAAYAPYLPASVPVTIAAGQLGSDFVIRFEQGQATTSVAIQGGIQIDGLKLADRQGQQLAQWQQLALQGLDLRPLDHSVKLATVRIAAPEVNVSRDASGKLYWQTLFTAPGTAKSGARPVEPAAGAAPASPWKVQLDAVELADGRINWADASTRPATALAIEHLNLGMQHIAWPMAAPIDVKADAQFAGADIKVSGKVSDKAATLDAQIAGLGAKPFAPYAATALRANLDATLGGQVHLDWQAGSSGTPDQLQVAIPEATLSDVALVPPSASVRGAAASSSVQRLKSLNVRDAKLDLGRHEITVAGLTVNGPQLDIERAKNGRWMYEDWLVADSAGASRTRETKAASARGKAQSPAWNVSVAQMALSDGQVVFADAQASDDRAVRFSASDMAAEIKGFSTQRLLTALPVKLSANFAGNRNRVAIAPGKSGQRQAAGSSNRASRTSAGHINLAGTLAIEPLRLDANVALSGFPLHVFAPYVDGGYNVVLRQAMVGYRGHVRVAMPAASAKEGKPEVVAAGDVEISDVRADSRQPAEELLQWNALALRKVQFDLGKTGDMKVAVGSTALTDFYARVIVSPQARVNLQDIGRAPGEVAAPVPVQESRGTGGTKTQSAQVPAPTASPSSGSKLDLAMGPMSLVNGHVYFSDHFIRPNYSADLTQLTGKLSAFRTGSSEMADLELRGRAEGSADVLITGKLNPTVDPLVLDIEGKVTGLELAPLSPYAGKYAGYAIERGKLSVNVHYKVTPDGHLDAGNQVILNQLTFGDKVDSPNATKLPVLLAVALLKDRNGDINVNLPVGGSLNDPEFSVGGVIVRVILNLLARAVTAPFSLIMNAFGGSADQLDVVAFPMGSSQLAADNRKALDQVAQALKDKTGLKVTVTGTSDLGTEAAGYRQAQVRELVAAEKRRELASAGRNAAQGETPDAASGQVEGTEVTAAEYPVLLKRVYRRADIEKPRNLVGLQKDVSVEDMEKLLAASLPADGDRMRQLALGRAVAVRDYLAAKGIDANRLYLAAPRIDAAKEKLPSGAPWKPSAQLSISTQ